MKSTIPRLLDEGYTYAYPDLIKLLNLSELDEIIEYKKFCVENPSFKNERKSQMISSWRDKYWHLPKFVHIRHMTLQVRTLALSNEVNYVSTLGLFRSMDRSCFFV